MDINKTSYPVFSRRSDQGTDIDTSYPIFRRRYDQRMDINKPSYPIFRRRFYKEIVERFFVAEKHAFDYFDGVCFLTMDYSSFNYFDVDNVIYFGKEYKPYLKIDREVYLQIDKEVYLKFEKRLASFNGDDVHKGLGYCPCNRKNYCRWPNLAVHLFKDCASVIYGLSCFHGFFSEQKFMFAKEPVPPSIGLIHFAECKKPGTLVFRIDFVHIRHDIVKHDDDDADDQDQGRDGTDDIKRDWRKNLYGLVGARRRRRKEVGRDYPPAGIVFFRDLNDEISDNGKKLAVTPDGQLFLSGSFIPLVVFLSETLQLDIDLSCSLKSSEQTLFDVCSYSNCIPGLYRGLEADKPKIWNGLHGAVEVGYLIISRAVYVRFVASIVIPSATSPLDIYGHITVDEHFRENQKSYLFYAERDSCQQLKHGDYLSFYMDSMTFREGKKLTIDVSLYQRSPSSTSGSDDIIFVNGRTSFSPSVANNEEENQQEKKIQFDYHDHKGKGVNFLIGIMDPRYVAIIHK